jgi:menaquinone-dependent protoporphyrinogen oxidase
MITVLVAYASKHHSTAEIAEEIGTVLKLNDRINVDVRSVDTVEHIALYDAVIIGSAVYVGQWQTPAAKFLEQHAQELSDRPVWLFSSGPTGQGNPTDLMKGWKFPEGLQAFAEQIKPRDIAFFHGKLDPERLNFLERGTIKMVGAPVGDFRNWDMIHEWAAKIAQALTHERVEPLA